MLRPLANRISPQKFHEIGSGLLAAFDEILIVNLPERRDRRREMTTQLRRVGLGSGVDRVRFFTATRGSSAHGFASPGAYGCFCSHLEILEYALDARLRAVLVLEDDLDFELPWSSEFADEIAPLMRDDWDVFYGGYHHPSRFFDKGLGLLNVGSQYDLGGTHFYGLHRRILPELVADLRRYLPENRLVPESKGHIDALISRFRNGRTDCVTWVLSPALGIQRRSVSDVQALRFYDRLPVVRSLARYLRRLIPKRKP